MAGASNLKKHRAQQVANDLHDELEKLGLGWVQFQVSPTGSAPIVIPRYVADALVAALRGEYEPA